jgi:hypothetical protein
MADYPGECFTGDSAEGYKKILNPFISFDKVRNNVTRCANLVSEVELKTDLPMTDTFPSVSFYIPSTKASGYVRTFCFF